ncbi:MAG: efflux RND transporter periplasmic adaptor subunit [Acidobacteriota bacterium]
MSEENRNGLDHQNAEIESAGRETENRLDSGKPWHRRPIIVGSIAIAVISLVLATAYLLLQNDDTGKPVPTPTTVSFGQNSEQQPTGVSGEQTITIEPDQLARIGLKFETVGETLSGEAADISSTGTVQANAYAETPVIPQIGGVIRRVNVELGEYVKKGQPVAILFSDELAAVQSRYLILQTEVRTSRSNYERSSKLSDLNPVSKRELDAAVARLKTVVAELEEHHQHHRRAANLLEIGAISREAFEDATTRLRTAEANVEEAKKQLERAREVARLNPVSGAEFEKAAVMLQTAESELASTRQKLIVYGLSPQRVASLRFASQINAEIALTAPVSGTITTRTVNAGEAVEANKEIMKVTDLAKVWVIAQVYEQDTSTLRLRSGASVTTDALPGRLFRGNVTYIDPNIDQKTRTTQVRVELENVGGVLRIGTYVNVAFGSSGKAESTVPVVPASAVQMIGSREAVFVVTDQPNVFRIKFVRLGNENDQKRIVLEGLQVGDRVVTDGSFLLRAEMLKAGPIQP